MYSEIVVDHFNRPRNVGEMDDASSAAEVGNPVCGDVTKIYIKVDGNVISDIKFKTFGCAAAIASGSMLTEMVKGKTLEEAMQITNQDVADRLGGLPPQKMHCSNLAADALHDAIGNYRKSRVAK